MGVAELSISIQVSRSGAGTKFANGLVLAAVLSLAQSAHASSNLEGGSQAEGNQDPAEPANRVVFAGNQFVDHNALKPVARRYERYVPGRVRKCIHNFTDNLSQPGVTLNDVLQGNFSRAWNTTERFAINTTVGGAGLFDVAAEWDRPEHGADFGQTLGVWGVGPGPAVQLPLFGSTNARDSVGKVVGLVTNPISFVPGGAVATVGMVAGGLGVIDGRAEVLEATDTLENTTLDYYAALRSVQAQRRTAFVTEGKIGLVSNHESTAEAPSKSP
jgi:phospholipid-binding lipoprotein MlaA